MAADELLRLAASLDQASRHIIAQTIVDAAHDKGLELTAPSHVVETPGEGVEGLVDGRRVIVGGLRFVSGRVAQAGLSELRADRPPGAAAIAVGIDGKLAGIMIFADELRAGTEALLRNLKALGVERIVIATGDRREVAEMVSKGLPIDAVRSELSPDQKTLVVLSERKNGPVMMIGDGVNDAPALAAADLGVAMGAKGAAASAEAADVVLLVDQLDRILPAIKIARRARSIALESVFVGHGPFDRGNDRRGSRLHHAGARRHLAGDDRCRGHPQLSAGSLRSRGIACDRALCGAWVYAVGPERLI